MSSQNIGTATLATTIDPLDRFAMWDATTGLWRPVTGAVMRDQLLGRSVAIGNIAASGAIGTAAATVDVAEIATFSSQTDQFVVLSNPPPSNTSVFKNLRWYNGSGVVIWNAYGQVLQPGTFADQLYVPGVGWTARNLGDQTVYQSAVDVLAPANDTNENTLLTQTIPGAMLGLSGTLMVRPKFDYTSNTNSKTFRLRLDGQLLADFFNSATGGFAGFYWDIQNRGSQSLQLGTKGTGIGNAGSAGLTGTVDTSINKNLTVTVQKGTGTDTVTMTGISISLRRSS